ncbi:hypothetical protein vseg_014476 [Gypsophila vaccaria]
MGDREDSPDWLRAFQPPTRSITTLSSDSEAPAVPTPDTDSTLEPHQNSPSNKTSKKRLNLSNDIPAKRRKTQTPLHSLDKPTKPSAKDHTVWALSSDSEPDSNAAIAQELDDISDSLRKPDVYDEEETSKVAKKGKSPKKQVKPKEKNKTAIPLEIDDSALGENEADEVSPTHKLSESMKHKEKESFNDASTSKVVTKKKSPKKRPKMGDVEPAANNQPEEPLKIEGEADDVIEERLPEKQNDSRVSSSTLSLILPEKVSRTKALVECEGESIDLSGDMGAVGRVIIPENPSGEPELLLDLKGTIYRTAIVPSRTFCVVSIGPSEAKIEAIMNDFIQLKAQSNVYDAETMVEGTLEGFSFDSEDEADKAAKDVKPDQNEGAEEQTDKKPRGKVEKKLGATQKKGKAAVSKQPKKRKPQTTKKSKGKK